MRRRRGSASRRQGRELLGEQPRASAESVEVGEVEAVEQQRLDDGAAPALVVVEAKPCDTRCHRRASGAT